MPLVPRGRLLVVSPWDVDEGVFIPDIPRRLHELPPPSAPLILVGEPADCEAVAAWLRAGKRSVTISNFQSRSVAPFRPAWRLWEPHAWVLALGEGQGKALDMGCGSGRDAVCLAANGWDVMAVDILPDALAKARDLGERYAPGARLQTLAEVPDGKQFDLITMIRYFDRQIFTRLPELLLPGGQAIVETYSSAHRLDTGKPRDASLVLSRELLPKAGFTIERWEEGPVWTRLQMRLN